MGGEVLNTGLHSKGHMVTVVRGMQRPGVQTCQCDGQGDRQLVVQEWAGQRELRDETAF